MRQNPKSWIFISPLKMVSMMSWMSKNATHLREHAKMTSFRSYTSSNYVRNIHLDTIYDTIQYDMWWLIQNILFSACLIVLIHYLYVYFETTLTTPKVKDLIRGQKHEYKSLLESINKKIDQPMTTTTSSPFRRRRRRHRRRRRRRRRRFRLNL